MYIMKLPFGIGTVEDLYTNNEAGSAGYFPLGTGTLWHSGIHINCTNKTSFAPLVPGKVVMYRISKDYKKVTLPEKISQYAHNSIFSNLQNLYRISPKSTSVFELIDKNQTIDVSNSFIMFKHELSIDSLTPEKLIFYTLYMNLEPAADTDVYNGTKIEIGDSIHHVTQDNEFSLDMVGIPAINKGTRYFDFVLILDKKLSEYRETGKNKRALFHGVNKNVFLHQRKNNEKPVSEVIYVPYRTEYVINNICNEKEGLSKEIELKSFRIYLKKKGELEGNDYKAQSQYKLLDYSTIWFSSRESLDLKADISTIDKNFQYLHKILNDELGKIKGRKVTVEFVTDSGQPSIRIKNINNVMKFWVEDNEGRFAQNENHFNENVAKSTEVKIFHSNPFSYNYSQIDTSDDLRKQIKDINEKQYIDSSGNVFFEALGKYSSYFIKEKDKDLCYKNAYDWKEWFFDYIPEDSNSLLCGKTSITENLIEWYEKLRKNNDWLTLALAPWWTGPYLTWEFLKSIFGKNPPREETEQMQEEFRHCICTHPIEWDAAVSSEVAGKPDKKTDEETISSRYAEFLKSQADATDLWNGGLSKIFPSNSLHFVHPVYFINHLEKAGAFEFNPYKGTTYAGVKVVNNPGFAPYLGEGKGINGYAPMTWAFNGTTTASKTIHAGMDFAIDFKKNGQIPIHSLIQGIVIADIDYGDNGFGNCILVQSCFEPMHYFIVAHMSRDKPSLKKNDEVYPGKIVGYVGNTGKQYSQRYRTADGEDGKRELQAINNEDRKYGYGAHLHLQFMKADHLDKIYTTLLLLHHTNVNSYNPIDYTIGWKG